MLDGSGTLAPGDSVTTTFDLIVDVIELAENSPLANQASVSATDPNLNPISDLSDDGDDPHGTNPTAPGDMGTMDDPTPILVANIGIAKRVVGTPAQLANGNWSVVYELVVENVGSLDLQNLQVSENLEIEFGAGVFVGVLSAPVITSGPSDPGSTTPTLDPAWDGGRNASSNVNLLDGMSGHLEPNDQLTFQFTVEVNPDATGSSTRLDNQADAYGEAVDDAGDPVTDVMGNPVTVTDTSDSGTDAEGSNPGAPGDMGTGDDPTPLEIPEIGVAKQVNQVTATAMTGVFDVEYVVALENTGTVDLQNIQTREDLVAELGASFDSLQSALTVTSTNLSVGSVQPNLATAPAWDGTPSAANFFDGTSGLLAPGDSIILNFTVRVDALAGDTVAPNDWTNQIVASADGLTSNGLVPVMDDSDDGTNPNTNNAGGTSDDRSELHTPQVRAVKTYGSITTNPDGTYLVPVSIQVQNTGLSDLSNLALIEDITSEFGNALLNVANPVITPVGSYTGILPTVNPAWVSNSAVDVIDPAQSNETLPIGEEFAFTFDAVVDPDAIDDQSQMMMNQATVGGEGLNFDGSTVTVMDQSGDPTSSDPAGNDLDNPSVLLIPEVRTAKVVTGVMPNGENWDVIFELRLENTGTTDLQMIDLVDDLSTQLGPQFLGVVNVTIDDTTGVGLGVPPTLNYGASAGATPFDGGLSGPGSENLLNNDGQLAPGEYITVTLIVTVDPDATGTSTRIENQAIGSGDDPNSGTEVSDPSDDGTNPNRTNTGSPGDTGGHDDPTPVNLPDVAITKADFGAPTVLPNGNFEVPYRLQLENIGTVDLDNLQITEDILGHFGAGVFVGVVSQPQITGPSDPTSTAPTQVAWDGGLAGNTTMFDGVSGLLVPGDAITVLFTVEIDPDANGPGGPLNNQVVATTNDPTGNLISDDSDDGVNPNSSNAGAAGDMGTHDDPTPISLAGVNVAKRTVGTPLQVMAGSDNFNVRYEVVLQNTGNATLAGLDLFDHVAADFGAAFVSIPFNPSIVANTLASAALLPTINTGWMADTTQSIFNDDGQLAPGETITVGFTVTVDSVAANDMALLNQVTFVTDDPVTGNESGPSDLSDDGSDPTTSNTGSPGDMGTFDDPTPVILPDATIGLAKAAVSAVGTSITLDFTMENQGNVIAQDIELMDDLDVTFGAGNYTVDSIALTTAPLDAASRVTVNALFDGSADQALLDTSSTNTLAIGDLAVVSIVVTITNFVDMDGPGPMTLGEYVNTASVMSTDGNGNIYGDMSTDGLDPDPDGNGDPTEAIPTPILVPLDATVGVAKESIWDDATDTAVFNFYLEHFGDAEALNLSMTEDFDAIFGVGNYVASPPFLISGPSTFAVNPAFNGSSVTELVGAGSSLLPTETAQLRVQVLVGEIHDPQGNGFGNYVNQVTITSENIIGEMFVDDSTDGSDPDPNDDGNPLEDIPSVGMLTPLPWVGGAKTALVASDATTVTFDFYLEHFGNTPAFEVSLAEDLDAVLGANNYVVTSIQRVSGPTGLTVDGTFNGSSNIELILPGSVMAPGETALIRIEVGLTGAFGFYANQGIITAQDGNGGSFQDQTNHGTDPDPDGDGDPRNNEDPTPFDIPGGELSGNVYVDIDGDGIFDSDEVPIPGVIITLTGTDGRGRPVSLTTTTAADGSYFFGNLLPGEYTVAQVQPVGFLDGNDTLGNLGGTVANDSFTVILTSGNPFAATNYNFGEAGLDPFFIGKDPFLASADNGVAQPAPDRVEHDPFARTDLVQEAGSTLRVNGSFENDEIEIWAGLDEHRIIINGVGFAYPAADFDRIEARGYEGLDSMIIHGTSLADQAEMMATWGRVVSTNYHIAYDGFEGVSLYGEGGFDRATLADSAGNDVFLGSATFASMREIGNAYRNEARGFEVVTGNAIMGGFDQAHVFGTPATDRLRMLPEFAQLQRSGGNTEFRANRFERVEARGLGGNDIAEFTDSAGDDILTLKYRQAEMVGDGFLHQAIDFERVLAESRRGGQDQAVFFDSPGDDRFVARPDESVFMIGAGYENRVQGFDRTVAHAENGGHDQATLYDSHGNDVFVARPTSSSMSGKRAGARFENVVHHFEVVTGDAINAGFDAAFAYDGLGDDHLTIRPDYAELRALDGSFQHRMLNFQTILAHSHTGGNDTATFLDTFVFTPGMSSNDAFRSSVDRVTMNQIGTDFRKSAEGFETIQAFSTLGEDIAAFDDVRVFERLEGRAEEATIQQRNTRTHGFERVRATSRSNHRPTADVDFDTVNYTFEQYGDWFLM